MCTHLDLLYVSLFPPLITKTEQLYKKQELFERELSISEHTQLKTSWTGQKATFSTKIFHKLFVHHAFEYNEN